MSSHRCESVFAKAREGSSAGGCGYLAYALLDAIVDNYFVILDKVGHRLETLEETIDEHPDAGMLEEIHAIRPELICLRKQVWPLREIIAHLQKDGTLFVGEAVGPFLRDVYDHTVQTIDTIESFRDILSGMQDLYLSIISNRMHELTWRLGYLLVWMIILAIVVGMLVFFRRKKWL